MLKRTMGGFAVLLIMSCWIYSQPAAKTDWKTFEDKKLGISFNYPGAGTTSVEKSFFDAGSFTVSVKTERTATTDLWWNYHLEKKLGPCSDNFSKPEPSDIPADIPKTKAIGKAVLALSVDTANISGFGDEYTSLGVDYHGAIFRNCWVAGYEENTVTKAPKPEAKVLAAMRAEFLKWVDSIAIRPVK
ncbi:MAG: hypothetical protein ACKVQJ_14160 [Pyrinomonadaceae bacterium]